ncbi:alpha-hydroxy acid oxidase [Nocardioides rubriscoriae]|uniref:alpha-hydroxy acid oxidase n=1 Tax=Nocardioides rubriscoriae TaxID=642762 RepID=UPI001B87351C|nr:alpha-hydroxy acid oxidase [Nocardioides rubriscoriae]
MSDARWLAGLEEQARRRLSPPVFDYVAMGARDGVTAAAAASSWRSWSLHPRVMRDVTTVDISTEVLGRRTAVPFGVAPTTLQRAVHPDGELAVARAVAAADGLMVVSSNAGTRFAELAATGVRWWVQCYLPADRRLAEPLLHRAVAAGADAVVLTVDTPVVGTKYPRDDGPVVWDVVDPEILRVNFDPGYDDAPGSAKALDLGAHDIEWLRSTTGLPVVVKGVLRPDDAVLAVDAGAAAVWVSNHGGRQLDRAVSTATVLADVVAAVAGRAQVYVDGGLSTGLDVVTALALGAAHTFVGRLLLFALVEGEPGVTRMLTELRAQTLDALRLCGARDVAETHGLVATTAPTSL